MVSAQTPSGLCLSEYRSHLPCGSDRAGCANTAACPYLDDIVEACKPRKIKVIGDFNVRGGIHTTVTAEHEAKGKKSKPKGKGNKKTR